MEDLNEQNQERNRRIINTVTMNDPLQSHYLFALEDLQKRYRKVHVRLCNKIDSHPRFYIDIEYRGHKAQVEMWGQDGYYEPNTEVMYSVVSLVSNKEVALRRIYKDKSGHLRIV